MSILYQPVRYGNCGDTDLIWYRYWYWHWLHCGRVYWLITRFSLHRWDSCWRFVLLPPSWGRTVITQPVYHWATGWTIWVLGFDARQGLGVFPFTTASRTALGPTQPPVQWVPGALSLGLKRPWREADHSPPFSGEVREWVEIYLHFSNTTSWRGV
jgi:hypothetical protein